MDKQEQSIFFANMVINSWEIQNNRVNKFLDTFSEEQWASEVAPNRNTGIYILGHLLAVNDGLMPLLGFGSKLFPEYEAIFLTNPDKSGLEKPTLQTLKENWDKVNGTLAEFMKKLSAQEWFTKHTAVSDEDFAKEPHRNKLNLLLSRTTHQSFHIGQLIFLVNK
jgi:DinB superfamily